MSARFEKLKTLPAKNIANFSETVIDCIRSSVQYERQWMLKRLIKIQTILSAPQLMSPEKIFVDVPVSQEIYPPP